MKQNLPPKDCSRSLFEVSTRWALATMIVMPCGALLASGAEKSAPDKPTVVSGDSASKKSAGASKESPADRLAEILKDTDNDNRHLRLTEMGMEMGKTDPKRGWDMVLNNFAYLPDRQVFGMAVIRYWARKQPHEALEACKDIPEGERRALAYSGALEGWARVSPAEASDWASCNLSGIYRRTAIAKIGKVWAYKQPRQAADWSLTHSNEVDKVFSLSEVLDTWADVYARDASEWAAKLPPGKLRDLAMSKAIFKWADYFPGTAAEWLVANPDHVWLLPRVVAKWGRHDPVAATTWLQQITNESLVQECRMAIVSEWAGYNPRVAFEWAQGNLKGAARESALAEVLETWGSDYPQEALSWAQKLPDASERSNAIEAVLEAWCRMDAEIFAAWVREQPPGLEKDIGIEKMASFMATTDPAAALNTLLTMQSQTRLQRSLTQHYQDWKLYDTPAAEAWLKGHPEAVKVMTP